MASSTSIPLLLILTISSSPLLSARDSQFFSKVTNAPTQTDTVVLPDKVLEQRSLVTTQDAEPEQEKQPDFVPQNQNEGHGLYGVETTETKSGFQTRTPATYASERYYSSNYNHNAERNRAESEETEQFGNREGETFYTNNGGKYQNDDASFYNNNRNGVETERYNTYTNQKDNGDKYHYSSKDQNDDALYSTNNYSGAGPDHYTTDSQKDNNYLGETETYYSNTDKNNQFGNQLRETETNYNGNGYTNELNTRYNTYRPDTTKTQNRGGSNVVRQGMSDTRFLENGKYYYDINKEEQYANQNTYMYKDVDRVEANYDDNSGGEKYEFNTMEEYERSRQNQYDP